MLALNRKIGEEILIAGGITVKVGEIKKNRVTLLIDAPKSVHVRRGELGPIEKKDEPEGKK